MLFNLYFADKTILSCFFFLIIDLHCLIPKAIAQTFEPIADLIIPIGIPSKKANAEIEIHQCNLEL